MITYVTSNIEKVKVAQKRLEMFGILLKHEHLDLEEIQSDSIEEVAIHKANDAFQKLNTPILVNDAGWEIPSLNGFPGPYMKYINSWFSEDGLLRLVKDTDRKIIYHEVFVYKSKDTIKVFKGYKEGTILTHPQGKGILTWKMVSLRDDGVSISKAWELNIPPVEDYPVWEEFAQWYKNLSS